MTTFNQYIHQLLHDQLPLGKEVHDQLLQQDRTLYACLLQLPNLSDYDTMEIVVRLLRTTQQNGQAVPLAAKQLEDRLIAERLPHLDMETVLEGLLQLVEAKVNNKRTSAWIRRYILGMPELEKWAVARRSALKKLLVHAMGKQVAQTCGYFLLRPTLGEGRRQQYLQDNLFNYAADNNQDLLRWVFLFLMGLIQQAPEKYPLLHAYFAARLDINQGQGLPYRALKGIAATYHPSVKTASLRRLAAKQKMKREVNGLHAYFSESLVNQFKQYYLKGDADQISTKVLAEAARLPEWSCRVALVLDLSASMQGTGNRLYNRLSIAMSIREVLQQKVESLKVITIGGGEMNRKYPNAEGATCLAEALPEAFDTGADLILVVTDGYENQEQGDAQEMLKAIRTLGYQQPVIQILPAFTEREDTLGRTPLGVENTILVETGMQGFLPLWLRLQLELQPDEAETILRSAVQPILN